MAPQTDRLPPAECVKEKLRCQLFCILTDRFEQMPTEGAVRFGMWQLLAGRELLSLALAQLAGLAQLARVVWLAMAGADGLAGRAGTVGTAGTAGQRAEPGPTEEQPRLVALAAGACAGESQDLLSQHSLSPFIWQLYSQYGGVGSKSFGSTF